MIEWDEVFEDVNWTKSILLILAGIVVIGVVVFIIIDYNRAEQMKAQLQGDLETYRNFQANWTASDAKLDDLKRELEEWRERYNELGIRLPKELDEDELEDNIRSAANQNRVNLVRLYPGDKGTEGYAKVQPFEILFSTSNASAAKNFLSSLHRMGVPHSVESEPLRLGGTMEVEIKFYAFNEDSWEEVNNCDLKVTPPDIPYRDIDNILIFKSMLEDIQAKVDQEAASLTDAKREFTKQCEMETELARIKTEYEIITENDLK